MNSRLVGRFGMRRISHSMLFVFTGVSLLWLLVSAIGDAPVPFLLMMAFYMVIMFSFGLITANFNALAMEPLGNIAGTASSVLGFTQTVLGALIGAFIGQAFDGTTTPIALGYFILGCIGFGCALMAERGKLFQPHNAVPPQRTND